MSFDWYCMCDVTRLQPVSMASGGLRWQYVGQFDNFPLGCNMEETLGMVPLCSAFTGELD